MSVLIKGVDMPKNCNECCLKNPNLDICFEAYFDTKRPPWCPLVEITLVEVVHCKDCKHRDKYSSHYCPWHGLINVNDDWFCADGERGVQQ